MNEVTTAPKRVQRMRTKGWRMPENTACVCRGTRWGNPFNGAALASIAAVHVGGRGDVAADKNRGLVALFANWLAGWPKPLPMLVAVMCPKDLPDPPPVNEIRGALRGKNLACWCAPGLPCHADVLLEIANG